MKFNMNKRDFEHMLLDEFCLRNSASSLSKRYHYERKAGVEHSEHWQYNPKDYVKLTLYYKGDEHCATWQKGGGSIPKWSPVYGWF